MICYNCFQEKGDSAVCPHCRYNPDADKSRFPTALPAGITLGKDYILGRVLGQGGFGITYIAKDKNYGARVAIKEYFPDSMATRDSTNTVTAYTGERGEGFRYGKQCFLEEAKTLAAFIGNPNIVRVYRYFEEYGTAYFVMEYIEGTSLKDHLKANGGKIDYIHGADVVENLAKEQNSLGILLPDMQKSELFPTVIKDGALPRKTFSMGHAADKRYYMECRKIEG